MEPETFPVCFISRLMGLLAHQLCLELIYVFVACLLSVLYLFNIITNTFNLKTGPLDFLKFFSLLLNFDFGFVFSIFKTAFLVKDKLVYCIMNIKQILLISSLEFKIRFNKLLLWENHNLPVIVKVKRCNEVLIHAENVFFILENVKEFLKVVHCRHDTQV